MIGMRVGLLAGLVLAVASVPVRAQGGPCASTSVELARNVIEAGPPVLPTAAQQQAYGVLVAALRRGDVAAARAATAALVRLNPALGRPPALCKLLNAAARQGTLQKDAQALTALRALARPGSGEQDGGSGTDMQRAAQTIADIQKAMHDQAVQVLQNLKS